jgi:hypothetical protein
MADIKNLSPFLRSWHFISLIPVKPPFALLEKMCKDFSKNTT